MSSLVVVPPLAITVFESSTPREGLGRIEGSAGLAVSLVSVIVVSLVLAILRLLLVEGSCRRNDGLPAMPCTRWKDQTMSSMVTGLPLVNVCLPARVSVRTLLSGDSAKVVSCGTGLVRSPPSKVSAVS